MPWVTGLSLNDWVEDHLGDARALSRLRIQVRDIGAAMEARRIAHGDLQHGNILVRGDGGVVLIDYDGMYVPDLAGKPMIEGGHVNYQHPDRPRAKFGPDLDRFSLAIIWSALEILEHSPHLWSEFDNGENLLFLAADFADPPSSLLLRTLRRDPKLAVIAERVERLSSVRVDDIPSLSDVVAGKLPAPPTSHEPRIAGALSQYQIVDLRRGDIELYEGDRVTVVGKVFDYVTGWTVRGDPYAFVVLGSAGSNRFKVVVWSEVLGRLGWNAKPPARGTLAAVTGLVTLYQGALQLELERSALFEAISDERARDLVGSRWNSAPPTHQRLTHPRDGDVVLHRVFGTGEVLRSRNDVATVRFKSGDRPIQFTRFELGLVSRKPRRGRRGASTSAGSSGPRANPAPKGATPAPKSPSANPAVQAGPTVPPIPADVGLAKADAQRLNALYGGAKGTPPPKAMSPSQPALQPASVPTPSPVRRSVQGSMPVGGFLAVVGAVVGYQVMSLSGAAIGAVAALSIYLIAKNSG